MRTVRNSSHLLRGRGVPGPGGCAWSGGLGVPGPRGCLLGGGAWSRGVSAGGVVSQHALRQTPPLNRMTNRCKNITFATSLRTVNIWKTRMHSSGMYTVRFASRHYKSVPTPGGRPLEEDRLGRRWLLPPGQTDTCENITIPQLRLRQVVIIRSNSLNGLF